MKKKLMLSLIFVVLVVICGCEQTPQATSYVGSVEVDFLFEHDGVRVYRFYDHASAVYFTTKGDVQSRVSDGETSRKKTTLSEGF